MTQFSTLVNKPATSAIQSLATPKTLAVTPSTVLGYSGSAVDNYGVSAAANNLLVQADGKIVVVGSAYNDITGSWDFALSRYNSNGSLDTGFSGDGRQTTDFGFDSAYSVAALAGGKLLVSGVGIDPITNISYYLQSRYNANGSLDTGFDGDGKATHVLTANDTFSQGQATQADGKLLQVDGSNGFTLVRYGVDGELDSGFGKGGVVTTDFATATGSNATPRHLAVQANGTIVVVGNTDNGGIALARYLANGSLDTTFSADGLVTENFGSTVYANSVAVQSDGKIVVAGYTQDSNGNQLLVARFNANGSVDSSFNNVAPAAAGISFTNTSALITTEAGDTAAFGVTLKAAPRHDVTLTLTLNDSTEGQFAVNQQATLSLTFTAANWNQVQTVSLKGVDDTLVDGDISYIVSTQVSSDDLRYDGMRSGTGLAVANIVATNADDDAPDEQYGDEGGKAVTDYLQGGNGASDLYGKDGRDELHGGNADDRLYGGYSDDVLYGDAGNDQLEGEQGDDKLNGGDGNDTLTGGTGNDKLVGGNGNDALDGSSGIDTMDGGNGADTYYVDNALDVVSDTGTDVGVDTVNIASYISSTFKYTLGAGIENALLTEDAKDADLTGNLSNNTLSGNSFDNLMDGGAGTDILNGGAGNDNLAGGLGNDKLLGGVGADSLTGGDGADQLNGGTGNDTLSGGNGSDTAFFGADNSTINLTTGKATGSTEGTDTLSGIEIIDAGAGNDVVTGAASADTLLGGLGNDQLLGGDGADNLAGGTGNDTLGGGNGIDTALFGADNSTINLTTGKATGSTEGTDTLSGIEIVDAGAGNDTVTGSASADTLLGGLGNDQLLGGDGADQLNGGAGNDNLSGGKGIDTALFGADNSTINLTTGKATGSTEGTDTLSGIEIVDAGAGNDTVTGSATADTLLGGLGNDNLSGATGNDILTGGNGTDKLTGGAGTDTFDFNALIESIKGTTRDSITDFTHSQADKIDLAGIDANSKVAGDQGFTYIGIKAFTGVAGQLDYFNGILAADTNGDKVADFEIAITLVGATALVSADFVL